MSRRLQPPLLYLNQFSHFRSIPQHNLAKIVSLIEFLRCFFLSVCCLPGRFFGDPIMVGFSPNHSGDRFYNPPAIRRLKKLRQQRLLEEEQERGRREEEERWRFGSGEADSSGLDGSPAAEGSLSVGTPSPQRPNGNLDRFLVSTTPVVPALFSPQVGRQKGFHFFLVGGQVLFLCCEQFLCEKKGFIFILFTTM